MDEPTLLKARTKRFAIDVIALIKMLPPGEPGFTIRKQITKCSTSVGANYRAACRARSHREFTAKMGTVSEESDETCYWLEVIEGAQLTTSALLQKLLAEADELCAIFSASVATARRREAHRKQQGDERRRR